MAQDQKPAASNSSNPSAPSSQTPQRSEAEQAIYDQARKDIAAEQAAKEAEENNKVVKAEKFEVPEGAEHLTHVRVSALQGVEVAPYDQAYDPNTYETIISKQSGFKGQVLHKGKKK